MLKKFMILGFTDLVTTSSIILYDMNYGLENIVVYIPYDIGRAPRQRNAAVKIHLRRRRKNPKHQRNLEKRHSKL